MISSFLPYPIYSGGHVRLYNLISELSSIHEITLVCEKRDNQTQKDITEVEKICKKVITVERRKQWSSGNLLKTAVSSKSFLTTGHTNTDMKNKIKKELENDKFDLIHVETFYILQNLPETSLPVVLAEHNVEYQVYGRYVDQVSKIIRPILSLDIAKIKKEEEAAWKKVSALIAVSEDDKKVMEAKGLKLFIVANGVDVEKFSFKNKKPSFAKASAGEARKILFIGDFKWIQNRDSVGFIINDVWPSINLKHKTENLKLWIVGRKIPDSVKNLTNDPNVIFDEESSGKPTQELFHEADVLLAPIRVGGGTSYKILESMSCGTPVVTTPLSAESLNAENGKNILVGQTADELANQTVKLLNDNKLYEKISKNARELIEKKYTWKKISNDLDSVYKSII